MARFRSPNHPQLDLATALASAKVVLGKDGRNRVGQQVLAKHLGHKALSGLALGKIGTLRAYSIIAGSADGLHVTDDAIAALTGPTAERASALNRLAFEPTILKEIRKQFPESVSEDNLHDWLINRHFTSAGAAKTAKVYLSNLRLVQESGEANIPPSEEEGEDMDAATDFEGAVRTPPVPRKTPSGSSGSRQAVFPLSEGDVSMVFPADLSVEGYEELDAYLNIFLKKAKREHSSKAQETLD